ncbi:MAG: hypothetical protein N2235_02410 [Fischerella sp.]|nr:hypothetical protein [Fischerella sp.]
MDFKKILEKLNSLSNKKVLNESHEDLIVLDESLVNLLKEADALTETWQSASAAGRAADRSWYQQVASQNSDRAGSARYGEKQWISAKSGEQVGMTPMQMVEKIKSLYAEYQKNPAPLYKDTIKALAAKGNIDLSKLGIVFKESVEEGWDDMMKSVKDREKEQGTGKFDKKQISTGTVYSRKAEKDDFDADEEKTDTPTNRGRGRPKKVSEMTDAEFFQALKEDLDEILAEKKMTPSAEKKREEIVKGMKRNKADLEKRYGSRWKEVMYATATKKALGENAKPKLKETTEKDFRHDFNHAELSELKKVANGELSWDDLSDGLQERVYEFYLHEMPYGIAKARTGDPYQWCKNRLCNDLGIKEQVGLSPAPTGANTTVVPTIPSVKQTLNASLGEVEEFETDNVDVEELKSLEQPITLNGGDYYYTADLVKDPLTWTADDGSTIKLSNLEEIGDYLDSYNKKNWEDYLKGYKSVDDLIDSDTLILNQQQESLYDNKNIKTPVVNESVSQLLKLAGLSKENNTKQMLKECGSMTSSQNTGSLNISTSYDPGANYKSVSVSASGTQADVLMQILANAGLAPMGGQPSQSVVVGTPTVVTDDDTVEEDYANSPNPKIGSLEAQLDSGNDMHRKKGSYLPAAGGDNPMASRNPAIRTESLEDKLWAEYQKLKESVVEQKQYPEDKKKVADTPSDFGKDGNANKKSNKKNKHEKQTLMDRSCDK